MASDPEWADDDEAGGATEFETARPDRVSLVLAALTVALVAAAAWLRFGPGLFPKPVQVGEPMPPTRLAALHDPGSRLLLGVQGEVLWLVFLAADSTEAKAVLPELEAAWKRLRPDRRFGMAVAAVDEAGPDRARAALETYKGKIPLYLAGRDAPRSFGIEPAGAPWHFLVDPHGRVAAVARGAGADTVDRLSKMASDWLGALEPASESRFSLTRVGARAAPAAGHDIVEAGPRS
ncbi:hypothetical protein [Paludisphaera mucosa]|uniref:Thioredoxin domain-containing protein n=1 Tax=Paludisphaera mucosa TaxID=3030827 RepID=A0ABT6F7V3_9BACT|nr:hypothetical protein [Paludisphaera mucosa]MDG3003654.1 hypothetical protein [Paludisphaera mucosa]